MTKHRINREESRSREGTRSSAKGIGRRELLMALAGGSGAVAIQSGAIQAGAIGAVAEGERKPPPDMLTAHRLAYYRAARF